MIVNLLAQLSNYLVKKISPAESSGISGDFVVRRQVENLSESSSRTTGKLFRPCELIYFSRIGNTDTIGWQSMEQNMRFFQSIILAFFLVSLNNWGNLHGQDPKNDKRPRLFKGGLIKRIEDLQEKLREDREKRLKELEKALGNKKKSDASPQKSSGDRDKDSKILSKNRKLFSSRRNPDSSANNSSTNSAPSSEKPPVLSAPNPPTPRTGLAGQDEPLRFGAAVRNGTLAEPGLIIERVDPASPAAKAGLKVGDRITSMGGSKIRSREDLNLLLGAFEPGDRTEVEFNRDGKRKKVLVEFPTEKSRPGPSAQNQTEVLPRPNSNQSRKPENQDGLPQLPLLNGGPQNRPAITGNPNDVRAGIGVTAVPVTPELFAEKRLSVRQGALIEEVTKGSAAEKSGLKPGDVIIALDGRKIDSAYAMAELVQAYKPGETAQILYYRGNSLKRTEVKLDAIPVSELALQPVPQNPQNPRSDSRRSPGKRNSILSELGDEFPRLKKVEQIIDRFAGPAAGNDGRSRPAGQKSTREMELENEVQSLREQLRSQDRQIKSLTEKLNLIERLLKQPKR